MSTARQPRVWVSSDKPARGDVVRVRAQIEHRMESGLRRDSAGQTVPRHLLQRFEARVAGQPVFIWEPSLNVSQNPYIEFTFKARASGTLHLVWTDDRGQVLEHQRELTVA